MFRSLLSLVLLPAALGLAHPPGARAQTMADFMGQSVCLSAHGAVLAGVTPLDAACTTRRKLAAGETPPYQLSSFSPAALPCPRSQGAVTMVEEPITLNGHTRIAALHRHATPAGCTGRVSDPVLASVQWHDSAYGFILGSGSPVALGSFNAPATCAQYPATSQRFSRGWVIAPSSLPASGGFGAVSLDTALLTGDVLYGPCPTGRHAALTSWNRDRFTYTGGAVLDTLVSQHWSHADATGLSPGNAASMERTYWTQEFGLTRWEKWSLESSANAAQLAADAQRIAARHECGAPQPMPAQPTPGMQVSGGQGFTFTLRDPRTGARGNWVLTLCADYSNLVRSAGTLALPEAYLGFWK